VSHSMYRRRRWRTFATTLALTLGSLAIPAAALADGQLDPIFNGTGFHVGSAAEGTVFANSDTRIPMVAQADGKIVIGGSRTVGGTNYMTLVRYNINGTIDTTFGTNGFAQQQFAGTPNGSQGNSGAVSMTIDPATTNIVVAGFGGSQSMVAARFSADGKTMLGSVVCFAPHLIDYTARAVAVRPDGHVVLVGYARDRFTTPATIYGIRAVVTTTGGSALTNGCGTYHDRPNPTPPGTLSNGSDGVQIDGLDYLGNPVAATDLIPRDGRYYDAVLALANNNYVVASTQGPDGNAWVQRYTNVGSGALDGAFNLTGRVMIPAVNFHALALRLPADGSIYAGGESVDAATAGNRQMEVVRIDANGVVGGFGAGGIAKTKVAGGNNLGQALAVQTNGSVIIGGGANLGGKSAFGLARFTPAGIRDTSFGVAGSTGQTVTPFGVPAVNGYITGMALTTNFIAVSGRLTDPGGLATVAARYYATGNPPVVVPPPPAASTQGVDQITTSSARVTGTVNSNGTASTWWIDYGTTAAYGSHTAAQPVDPTDLLNDVGEQGAITGLAMGTVYHARIVISNSQGTVGGDDVVFTTAGTAPAGGATGGTTGTTGTTTGTGGSKGTTTTTTKKKKVVKQCVITKVTGKTINKARTTLITKGCKVKVLYKKSTKKSGTVLSINRKVGKKLVFHALVKVTVAKK
jgi:uncharacterized delta-60 repeat protein